MNLLDYLNLPDRSELLVNKFGEGFLGKSIVRFSGNEDISSFKVGLVGVDETRNSYPDKLEFKPDIIRKYLYNLSGFSKCSVIDFGNLKRGNTIDDTYASIQQVLSFFKDKNIVIVFVGGTQELSVAIGKALLEHYNKFEVAFIDALLDNADASDFHSKSYLSHQPFTNNLKVIKNILGYQTYLVSQNSLLTLKSNGYNYFRLGSIRNNFQSIEPILRDTDLVSFDLSALRQSDSPASDFNSPNGFYAEEACQLANICGLSDKVKIMNICGIDTAKDESSQSSHLLAQIIWHFILGLSKRPGDFPLRSLSTYKKIYVSNEKLKHELVFYQNEENNRFWVELPNNGVDLDIVISCSEADYFAVCNNEIPERIWKRISNTMK